MRFIEVKSEQVQVLRITHRIRSGYIKSYRTCMRSIGLFLFSLATGHLVVKRLFV